MIMNTLLRAVSFAAFFDWYSYMARLGPIDRSYQELMYNAGAPEGSPSPPNSTSFHRGSFGCHVTNWSRSLGAASIAVNTSFIGSVQMALSRRLVLALSSGSRFHNWESRNMSVRVNPAGNEGLYL